VIALSSERVIAFGSERTCKALDIKQGNLVLFETRRTDLPEQALSMRKIREVLRLSAMGLAQRQIARSCSSKAPFTNT
jgi:hypothetical protein